MISGIILSLIAIVGTILIIIHKEHIEFYSSLTAIFAIILLIVNIVCYRPDYKIIVYKLDKIDGIANVVNIEDDGFRYYCSSQNKVFRIYESSIKIEQNNFDDNNYLIEKRPYVSNFGKFFFFNPMKNLSYTLSLT